MTLLAWFELELTRPAMLGALVLLLPVLAVYFIRSLVDFARGQQIASLTTRALIGMLLVLALAGLTLSSPTHEQFVVFVVDQSLSVSTDATDRFPIVNGTAIDDESPQAAEEEQDDDVQKPQAVAKEFLDKALEHRLENRAAFLDFAAAPGIVHVDRDKESPELDEKGTDIAAAIEVAAASIPPFYVPKIVLLTDGNQTHGDALKAALSAGVAVSTVPLKTRDDAEVQVASVTAPAQVAQGEPFYVEVTVDSNHADEGTIEVYRGPHKVVSEKRKLKKGENKLRFRQSIESERLAEFTVRITGFNDTLLDNNSDSGLVFSSGKPRVLVVESDPKLAKHLVWALEEEGILVDTRPPQGMPESLTDLQNYELIVLSNVPATRLSMRQMEIARTYVQDLGGGLIMLGGDQSFGLGGYYKTVLEEILPVRSDFEKEKEKPSLAMVLVIDKSGSMGGEKIELAKDAGKAAVELLGPSDKIGVIAFEGDTYWVSDIHPCSDKAFVIDRISTIEAGGGTNMYPAMEEAYLALQSAVAKLKHVIILTDGISAPGDFEGITQSMTSSRMTVSTVGVGEGADERLLEEIARIGNGRYYFTNDPTSIPQIFAKETVTASKSAINEQPFVPQMIRPTTVLAGVGIENAPFLLGYVVTRPKPTSELVLATEAGDPLLSWWRYGLGMSVAFTADAKSRWAAEWLTWPGFSKFWAQVVRHAMRKSEAKGFLVEVERKAGEATVTLDSVDPAGRYLNNAETELTLIDPQLRNKKVPMAQTAPGRYVGKFATPDSGAYHLELAQTHQGRLLYRQSRGLAVGYAEELRLRPTDEKLLQSVAEVTGGVYDVEPENVFDETEHSAQRATPLWPYLISIATALFVLDVALRRIDFALVFGPWFRRKRPGLHGASGRS